MKIYLLSYLLLLAGPVLAVVSDSSSCYFPDGTLATSDYPCFPGQANSICCGFNHTCMSNNLCRWPDRAMKPDLSYIRGSCTDKGWTSGDCTKQCQKASPQQWSPIHECSPGENCCQAAGNCCSPASIAAIPLFEIPTATTVTVIGAKGYATVLATTITSLSTTPAAASTAPSPPSSSVVSTNASGPSVSVPTTVIPPSPAATLKTSNARGVIQKLGDSFLVLAVMVGGFLVV